MKQLISAAVAVGLTLYMGADLNAQNKSSNATVSLARARAIALAHVPHNEGVTSSKLKHKGGVDVYEFDIETPGPGHQEVRVNTRTGAIISSSHEDDIVGKTKEKVSAAVNKTADKVFGKDEYAKVNPGISEQRARSIAQQQYPNAPIKDVDLETKHGVLVWEIDLDTAGPGHAEVLIDASTGDVLRRKHHDDIIGGTIDKIKKK